MKIKMKLQNKNMFIVEENSWNIFCSRYNVSIKYALC